MTLANRITSVTSFASLVENLEPRQLMAAAAHRSLVVTNLVSDGTTVNAQNTDAQLVNAWGLAQNATTGEFFIAANGSGTALTYNNRGVKQPTAVTLPVVGTATQATPTGEVANTSGTGFVLSNTAPADFIFVGEDGVISGSNSGSGTVGLVAVDSSAS